MTNQEKKEFIRGVLQDSVPTTLSQVDTNKAVEFLDEILKKESLLPISIDTLSDKIALSFSNVLFEKGLASDTGAPIKAISFVASLQKTLEESGYMIVKK